jgi:hypothetical protein
MKILQQDIINIGNYVTDKPKGIMKNKKVSHMWATASENVQQRFLQSFKRGKE